MDWSVIVYTMKEHVEKLDGGTKELMTKKGP